MTVGRRSDAQGFENLDVLGRIHDMVLSADDVGHAHFNVVDDIDEVKDIAAVGALDDHVGGIGCIPVVDGDGTADDIVEGDGLGAVETESPGTVAFVNASGVDELLEVGVVDMIALALEVGTAVSSDHGAFVPVHAEPAEAVEYGLGSFLGVAFLVGVFDTEDESTFHLAGEEPVEEGCACAADMEVTGGRGCETGADLVVHGR